jgi:hypothetical protein
MDVIDPPPPPPTTAMVAQPPPPPSPPPVLQLTNKYAGGPTITDVTEAYNKQLMAARPREITTTAAAAAAAAAPRGRKPVLKLTDGYPGGPTITDITEAYNKQIMAGHPREMVAAAAAAAAVAAGTTVEQWPIRKPREQLSLPAPVAAQLALMAQSSAARAVAVPQKGTIAVLRAPLWRLPDIPDFSAAGELMSERAEPLALPAPPPPQLALPAPPPQLALPAPSPPRGKKRQREESAAAAAAGGTRKKGRKSKETQRRRTSSVGKKSTPYEYRRKANVPVHTHSGSHVHQVAENLIPDFTETGQLALPAPSTSAAAAAGKIPTNVGARSRRGGRNPKRKRGEEEGEEGKAGKKRKTKGTYITVGKGRHAVKRKTPATDSSAPRKSFKKSVGKSGTKKRKHVPSISEWAEEQKGRKRAKIVKKMLQMGNQ